MRPSAYDRDNDNASSNCAKYRNGRWWFKSCSDVNLNGWYYKPTTKLKRDNVFWKSWRD